MGKYKQYKRGLSAWISSEKGQRFFNFAYSIGAAIVIWGALFKILHLPGGNFLLSLGMGTEVLMFTLTAFDRPPRDYKWENVFPVFDTGDPDDRPDFKAGTGVESYRAITENSENITRSSTGYVEQMQGLNRNIQGLNTIYEIQLKSVSSQLDAIDRVNAGIKEIRDMYERSSSQSARYCEETEKMALYMHQLNSVYEKMINAMTINMYAANPLAAAAAAQTVAPQPAPAAPAAPVAEEPQAQQPQTQAVPPQYQGASRRSAPQV